MRKKWKRILIAINFIFFADLVYCQNDIQTQIQSSFHQVNSIDPKQKDFSDLESFGKAIANSRIVFLGEQDHGDAPTFLAKTRLIEYLHEKMGFDVLVFESDFWGLNTIWDNHLSDSFSFEQIKNNTYGIWSRCVQTQELYSYLEQTLKTNDPLIVSGMDCRHALPYSTNNYTKAITSFTRSQSVLTADTVSLNTFLKLTNELIEKEYSIKTPIEQQQRFVQYLDKITPNITDSFWKQEFINLKGFALNSWNFNYKDTTRDITMAQNLLWLTNEKYKGKKIIVWAHSAHIAMNTNKVKNENSTSMGNEVSKTLKDSIYILGFSSLTGRAGRITFAKKYTVQKAKKDGFESWVNTMNYDYGFVNFKPITNSTDFYMKGLGHTAEKTNWTKVFDGVFYIKNMYPCDKTN